MPLFNGTNAPTLKLQVNIDNTGLFLLGYSTLQATTGDVLGVQTDNWVDLPITDVRAVSIRRGRTRENQAFQPGTMVVTLDNWGGNYDPDNTASPYRRRGYSYFVAGLNVRLMATWSGSDYFIYEGIIESVDTDLTLDPTVTLNCVDKLAWIAKQVVSAGTYFSQTLTLYRIQDILLNIGWTDGISSLSGQVRRMQEQTLAEDTLAQDLIDQVVDSDAALAFVGSNGAFIYESFDTAKSWQNYITFSDQRTNGTIEYDEIVSEPGSLYIVNDVELTTNANDVFPSAPLVFKSQATTSAGRFGTYPVAKILTVQGYASGGGPDPNVQALADYMATVNDFPQTRISFIAWDCLAVGFNTSIWVNLLLADIGNKATVNRTTVDGRSLSYTCQIQAINHDITPNSWRMSAQLSPG